MIGADDCIFCAIVAGDAPAYVVHEDEETMAFLGIHPPTDGHTLVVPKVHAQDIFDIRADDLAAVTRTVHRVAAVIDQRLSPDGLTIAQANRPAGWQTVFHLHVHLVPRYLGDDLVSPWTETPAPTERLEAVHRQLVDPGEA